MLGRSWYRFSLRSLLVACAVCCAALAVWRWYFAPDPIVAELESLGCRCWDNGSNVSNRLRANDVTDVGVDVDVALAQARDLDAARINQLLRRLPGLTKLTFHDDDNGVNSDAGVRDPRIDAKSATVLSGLPLKRINFSRHAGAETAKVLSQTKSLQSMWFGRSPSDSVISSLVQYHSVQDISITNADISTLALLSREQTLLSLHLDEPQLAGLSALEKLPKSVDICLSFRTVDDALLQSLSRLDFPFHLYGSCGAVSDSGLAALEAEQTPLLSISLGCAPHVTDVGLSLLSRVHCLEVVDLSSFNDLAPLSSTEIGVIELLNAGKEVRISTFREGEPFGVDKVRRGCPGVRVTTSGVSAVILNPPAR